MSQLITKNFQTGLIYICLSALVMQLAYAGGAIQLFGYFFKGSLPVLFMVVHVINRNIFHLHNHYFNFLCTFILITVLTAVLAYVSLLVAVKLYLIAGGRF